MSADSTDLLLEVGRPLPSGALRSPPRCAGQPGLGGPHRVGGASVRGRPAGDRRRRRRGAQPHAVSRVPRAWGCRRPGSRPGSKVEVRRGGTASDRRRPTPSAAWRRASTRPSSRGPARGQLRHRAQRRHDPRIDAAAHHPLPRKLSPATGDPATMLVRFSVDGFGLLDAQPNVYVHYVGPGGKVRQTVDLGMARGVCGHLAPTSPRRLFPFRARAGRGPCSSTRASATRRAASTGPDSSSSRAA